MAKKQTAETDEDSGNRSVAVNDAWTGMLAISFFALAGGTGLLAWDYLQYNDDPPKAPAIIGTPPPTPKVVIDPLKDAAAKDAAAKDAGKKDMP